jgi:tRNA A-37 threonylcarbamoyl transferase component Bud32
MSIHHFGAANGKPSGRTTTILSPPAKSRKCMALVPGSASGLTDELNDLLRRRLRIVCLIWLAGTGAFFLRSIVAPTEDLASIDLSIHGFVLFVLAGASALLWSKMPLCTPRLRFLELISFGAVLVFFGYLQYRDLESNALLNGVDPDEESRVFHMAVRAIAMRWFVIIALYGTFIPNTWRRCLAVVSVFTALPMVLLFLSSYPSPIMGPLWPTAMFDMFVILSVASATAIFGSHRISELQQQALEAKKLGQYQLKKKIGSGGMGEVYLAEHVLLRRHCAIKTIKADHTADALTLARFEREVQAMATLTHWNSVEIYDYGHSPDGTFFYVMEYLPGLTLQEMIDRHGAVPPGRAIHFLRQVCAALKEAHSIRLIHRDIKPSNVLVCQRGGAHDVAKLLDFGLVQDIGPRRPADADRLTMQGAVLGSPPFISPEQARGNQPVDERTDIYGLGGLAFFLVTGRPPFERDSALEMMAAHLHEKPISTRELRPNIPIDLDSVILRCLEKKPADRFQSVAELDRALADCDAAFAWDEDQARAWWKEIIHRVPGSESPLAGRASDGIAGDGVVPAAQTVSSAASASIQAIDA